MNDHITGLLRSPLGARIIAQLARWKRRLSGRMQAGDTFARQAGWTITRTRSGGRIYRDPRFAQLSAARTPGPPPEPAPSAVRPHRPQPVRDALPAPGTSPSPGPAGWMEPQGRSR
jgi:hypothetical protein